MVPVSNSKMVQRNSPIDLISEMNFGPVCHAKKGRERERGFKLWICSEVSICLLFLFVLSFSQTKSWVNTLCSFYTWLKVSTMRPEERRREKIGGREREKKRKNAGISVDLVRHFFWSSFFLPACLLSNAVWFFRTKLNLCTAMYTQKTTREPSVSKRFTCEREVNWSRIHFYSFLLLWQVLSFFCAICKKQLQVS